MAAEPFELGGMYAAVRAGGERAAFEAVAAAHAQPKAGGDGMGLDDLGDGTGVDRRVANDGGGEGALVWVATGQLIAVGGSGSIKAG